MNSEKDKLGEAIDKVIDPKIKKFDVETFRRLITKEIQIKSDWFNNGQRFCGFSRCQIQEMAEKPERFGRKILSLSDYMYLKSGYYKRIIDYFANQATANYTILPNIYPKANKSKVKEEYYKFARNSEKVNLSQEIHNIFKRLFKHDVVYAFVDETTDGFHYYYLDPQICGLSAITNGNIFQFYINYNSLPKQTRLSLPNPVLEYAEKHVDKTTGRVYIPHEKSLCIKYNNDFLFPYPPFFMMIADILLIDEYKDLAKAQCINDAYKILTMKIPTHEGEITLDDELISAFVSVTLDTLQNNIGVVTTPFDMASEEFSSSSADDRDTVSDAISWAFKNVGISEALMSGASNGSELKLSVINDDGDIFRIYRMLEDWVMLQLRLRGHVYDDFDFKYKILDITTFNRESVQEVELSAAQNGLPNKIRLSASYGYSPIQMLSSGIVENELFADVFEQWQPLKTSYTQSSTEDAGRPVSDDDEISEVTETQRANGSNDTDNRI